MQSFIIEPSGLTHQRDLALDAPGLHGVAALQRAVGGWFEALSLSKDLVMWMCEDAIGQEPNPIAVTVATEWTNKIHLIAGTVVVTGHKGPHAVGLTEEQAAALEKVAAYHRRMPELLEQIRQGTQVKLAWMRGH